MIVYIVGAITGNPKWKRQFSAARANIEEDTIISPMDYPEGLKQKQYMMISAQSVFIADMLITLPGWVSSPGAKAEVALALSIGTIVKTFEAYIQDVDVSISMSASSTFV